MYKWYEILLLVYVNMYLNNQSHFYQFLSESLDRLVDITLIMLYVALQKIFRKRVHLVGSTSTRTSSVGNYCSCDKVRLRRWSLWIFVGGQRSHFWLQWQSHDYICISGTSGEVTEIGGGGLDGRWMLRRPSSATRGPSFVYMGEVITYPDTKIVSCEIMVEHAAYHIKVAVGDLALWGFTWSEGRHNVIWEMRLTYYGVRSCRIGCLLRSASMRLQYLWDCYGSRENVTPTHVTRGIVIFIQGGVDRHQILKLRLVPLRIFC